MTTSATGTESKHVAVIGGGYTGLVAALRLAQAGTRVTVIEKSEALGGLAGGFEIEGHSLEKAYHHIFRSDRAIIDLADELGVSSDLEWLESKDAVYYGGKVYPFSSPIDLIRFTPLSFASRVRMGLVGLYLRAKKNWRTLESTTAYEWMLKACGARGTKVIWEPLLRGKFDSYFDKVSMAWLWARIHIRANSTADGELSGQLGYFAHGFETFTSALVAELENKGVRILRQDSVRVLKPHSQGYRIELASGTSETVDSVALTIPSSVSAQLLTGIAGVSDDYLSRLRGLPYLSARVLVFSSEQDISDFYWHNINDVNLPFLVFINHTKLTGTARYSGKNVYYIATYAAQDNPIITCSNQELVETWFDGLKTVFPGFDEGAVREKHAFNFAHAQHVVEVGYGERIPGINTGAQGLFVSNFAQIYPEDRGTNYAVLAGENLAELVLADLANRRVTKEPAK